MLSIWRKWWIELAAGATALGIGIYQLSLPHVLTGVLAPWVGYDDGVYAGVAIRLVHGVLPYRDFVFVQPPGIALLLSPLALIGFLSGSSASVLVLARIVTVAVVAINVVLTARLVRPVGRVGTAAAAFLLALWPLTVSVDRGVELEPYLVLFCLVGALLAFKGGSEPSTRRLVFAGVAFGFACVLKVWAILPIIAIVLVFLPCRRRELRWLLSGVIVVAAVCCLPFFITAPRAFIHEVLLDQLFRQVSGPMPFGQRLLLISGFSGLTAVSVSPSVAVTAFVALLFAVALVYGLWWRERSMLEWYFLAVAVVTFIGMFEGSLLVDHYAYFPASMSAPLVGSCTDRLVAYVKHVARPLSMPFVLRGLTILAMAAAFGVGVFGIDQDTTYLRSYLSSASDISALESHIPPGACVMSDYASTLIMANRFTPATSGCPAVIDPYGMYLSDDNGSYPHVGGSFPFSFQLEWFSDLQQCSYVELRIPFSDFIPWSNSMIIWFQRNYRLVAKVHDNYGYPIYLYERIA